MFYWQHDLCQLCLSSVSRDLFNLTCAIVISSLQTSAERSVKKHIQWKFTFSGKAHLMVEPLEVGWTLYWTFLSSGRKLDHSWYALKVKANPGPLFLPLFASWLPRVRSFPFRVLLLLCCSKSNGANKLWTKIPKNVVKRNNSCF